MRNLAHIEKITSINPIVGADMIEVATVLGWECVIAKKDNFKVNDLVVYIEVDSILPEKSEYEFLRSRKFRIRTIKLKGQISQGLILPISVLDNKTKIEEGKDVTDLLGIIKYDPEVQSENETEVVKRSKLHKYLLRYAWFRKLNKKKTDNFPSHIISKSDQERIQSIPSVLEQFKDKKFTVTEKVDYQSVTFFTETKRFLYFFKKKTFGVCSRNKLVNNKNSLYWQIAKKYDLENIMKSYKYDLAIQGEQGNNKIQGNKYKITEPTLWIYTMMKNQNNVKYYFDFNEMQNFCEIHNLQTVPLIDNNFTLLDNVKDMIEYSKGKSVINKDVKREGVVISCIENGRKILSFKCINPDFLIEHNE